MRMPRTCCPTHADRCHFGRPHTWAGPFLLDGGNPVNGERWSRPGDARCFDCGGVCTADREPETPFELVMRLAADLDDLDLSHLRHAVSTLADQRFPEFLIVTDEDGEGVSLRCPECWEPTVCERETSLRWNDTEVRVDQGGVTVVFDQGPDGDGESDGWLCEECGIDLREPAGFSELVEYAYAP